MPDGPRGVSACCGNELSNAEYQVSLVNSRTYLSESFRLRSVFRRDWCGGSILVKCHGWSTFGQWPHHNICNPTKPRVRRSDRDEDTFQVPANSDRTWHQYIHLACGHSLPGNICFTRRCNGERRHSACMMWCFNMGWHVLQGCCSRAPLGWRRQSRTLGLLKLWLKNFKITITSATQRFRDSLFFGHIPISIFTTINKWSRELLSTYRRGRWKKSICNNQRK